MGNKRKAKSEARVQAKLHKKPKKAKASLQDVPLPEPGHAGAEEEELALSDEDLEFVQQHGQQLGFLTNLDAAAMNKAVQEKQKGKMEAAKAAAAAAADAEQGSEDEDGAEYERRPRAPEKEVKRPSQGLPVKTLEGDLVYRTTQDLQQQKPDSQAIQVAGIIVEDTLEELQRTRAEAAKKQAEAAAEAKRKRQEQKARQAAARAAGEAAAAAGLPPALAALAAMADKAARRAAAKQAMAVAAQKLLAAPEDHVGELRTLQGLAVDGDGVVARLGQLSLLAVFKDIVPGYRIRPGAEREQEGKVSKDVQRLWDYESALLRAYQAYLKTLLAAANSKGPNGTRSAKAVEGERVAVRCMAGLLTALPHFNYTSDLLQALVPRMVAGDAQVAAEARGAVQQLLTGDVQGKVALEALQLVADLVKRRKCACPAAVLSTLLVLRFTEIKPAAQQEAAAAAAAAAKKGGKGAFKGGKGKKGRGPSQLDKDFAEADVAPDAAQQALLQSQMLEALFEVFFRVLKHCANAAPSQQQAATDQEQQEGGADSAGAVVPAPWSSVHVARRFPLLQPALEGIGRYCHLLDIDYFNDLLEVLRELLACGALPVAERLRVLLTATHILSGHGEALNVDRRQLYLQLYSALLLVPLAPLAEDPGRPHDSGAGKAGPKAGGDAVQAANGAGVGGAGAAGVAGQQTGQQGEDDGAEDGRAVAALHASTSGEGGVAVLLVRCLERLLLGSKQADLSRLAAFTKRLATLLLQCNTGEAMGLSALLLRLVKRYPRLTAQLEWEGGAPVGGRAYSADCPDPSEAGALAAALWELPLLLKHYHPHVAAAARTLLDLSPGISGAANAGTSGPLATAAGPQELAAAYDSSSSGRFKPAPAAPTQKGRGTAGSKAAAQRLAHAAARPLCTELAVEIGADADAVGVAGPGPGSARAAEASATAAGVVANGSLGVDAGEIDAAASLARYYRVTRRWQLNQQLRRECELEAARLRLFQEHLIQRSEKEKQQQQQQQQQAATATKAAGAAGNKQRSAGQEQQQGVPGVKRAHAADGQPTKRAKQRMQS